MSFLYPRTIAVHRTVTNDPTGTAKGAVGYAGRVQSPDSAGAGGESVILSGVPATIQSRGVGRVAHGLLAGNITSHPQWRILTRPIANHTIRDEDIIVDDEGYRYQVAQNYWTPMGYRLDCVRLEA